MFLAFTPFTFLFFTIYSLFFLFLFSRPNFILFWVYIEFIILIFIGMSYTMFSNNFSSLMLYFLVQTVASFRIFLFYLYPHPVLLPLSFFLKLSMFPFHFWFLNICYRFPNFVLFLSSSLHKLPVFLIIMFFSPSINGSLSLVSVIVTVFISGCMMLVASDFRSVLLSSSVGNNSWFMLSSFVDLFSFILFFAFYSFFLYLLVREFSTFTKPSLTKFSKGYFSFLLYVVFIRGLPPFPIFFAKMYIIFSLFAVLLNPVYLFLFIAFSSLMLVGYIYSISKYFVHSFSTPSLLLV